jgi:hypothetical protein
MVLNLRTGQGQKIMKPVLIYVLDERTGQGQKIMKPRGLEIPIIDIYISIYQKSIPLWKRNRIF